MKSHSNIPSTTTAAQDLTAEGQRSINRIWEYMQAMIAASVVGVSLYVSCRLSLLVILPEVTEKQMATANTAFMLISNLVSLIIGFYFGRTNHQRIGGVGANELGR